MEKKIVICIGTDESNHVRARLSLLLVDDGKTVSRQYHSLAIEPGADLSALRSGAETAISDPRNEIPLAPWPAIPDEEWEKVEKCCALIQTPAVVQKWEFQKEARLAEERIQAEMNAKANAKAEEQIAAAFQAAVEAAVNKRMG